MWFEPGIHRVVLPISIIEDNVPEIQEQFELAISALSNYPQVVIPADGDFAVVNIVDNDGIFSVYLKRFMINKFPSLLCV